MGTRNLTCVVKDGQYKIAQYGQWDGYPDGQGLDILDFLTHKMNREVFEQKVAQVISLTEDDLHKLWVDMGIVADVHGFVGMDQSDKFYARYPELSRDRGAEILGMVQDSDKPMSLELYTDFAGDSLFCEWAYVIDLDKNTFEVYKGFNEKEPLTEEDRFYFLQECGDEVFATPKSSKYYPVKLAQSFDLNNLPSKQEFLDCFKSEEEED